MNRGAADRGQAQEVGQLMNDDDDRHAGEEAGDDRRGQEFGDPAQAQETDEGHDDSDHHGEDADQVDVAGRVDRSKVGNPHREERGDRGVCPHRHLRVRPEHGEENRAGDERVEGGDRRHAGKPGGRELFRHDDGEKRHHGERVGTGKRRLVAAQRLKERTGQVPVCLSLLPGRRAKSPESLSPDHHDRNDCLCPDLPQSILT